VAELAEVKLCVFHVRGDFIFLSWKEVWSRIWRAWSRDVVRGIVNNLVAVVA